MTTDLRFSGQAAQLGRPGVVKDVSNKLVGQFAECIKGQLSAAPEERAAAVEQAQEPQKPISGMSLAVDALVGAIKRLFGIGREGGRPREAHHASPSTASAHEADVEERELLVYFLREGLGLTGTNVGCDTTVVRGLHRPRGRRVGEVVQPARGPGRRRGGHHHRGPRHQRRDAPDAGRLPGAPRPPVRLLHAGDDHGGRRVPEREPEPDRGRDPPRPRGQPLPLHRLPEHRQGRLGRGEA